MGGIDKASIEIHGRTLLERSLAALATLVEIVVVGPEVPTSRPVTFTREDPAGGGPAAGLLAGLDAFPRLPDLVLVLAVDMPRVTGATVQRLRAAVGDDGAVLVDGRRQHLCAAYRTGALLVAAPPLEGGTDCRCNGSSGAFSWPRWSPSATRPGTWTPGSTCGNSRSSRPNPLAPTSCAGPVELGRLVP